MTPPEAIGPEAIRPPADEGEALAAVVSARLDVLESGSRDGVAKAEARLRALRGGSRFETLLALFGGGPADRAVLLTSLAPQLDPRLVARYRALGGWPWPTEWLAGRLFPEAGPAPFVQARAAALWRLVEARVEQVGEPPALVADPSLRGWIAGGFGVDPEIEGALTQLEPRPALEGWPASETAARLSGAAARGEPVVLFVEGLQGSGRATFATLVAEALGRPAVLAEPEALHGGWGRAETLRAHRFALVTGSALVWRGPPPERALWPPGLWPPALQAVTLAPGEVAPEPRGLAPVTVALPPMAAEERLAMLDAALPAARGWPQAARVALGRRRALTPAAVARLGRLDPQSEAEALDAASRAQDTLMGGLAQRMTGALGWDDLVLPDRLKDDLRDLAFEAEARARAWTEPEMRRLFSREAGLVALFQGPPGTGKTMAAQVVARALGLDLYRIDCAAVVSKYIGETSKNLRAIFERARRIDAVLFFDEADALFARRTEVKDAHDRHANADTSYLLQLIEGGFDGAAILATNRTSDIDAAFVRRIRYVFEFPRPTPAERTEIWRRAARALAPETAAALDALWPALGDALDVTGAQIKTTLLSAHFAAARRSEALAARDLLRAAERELGKEGRSLGARERERIRSHA